VTFDLVDEIAHGNRFPPITILLTVVDFDLRHNGTGV